MAGSEWPQMIRELRAAAETLRQAAQSLQAGPGTFNPNLPVDVAGGAAQTAQQAADVIQGLSNNLSSGSGNVQKYGEAWRQARLELRDARDTVVDISDVLGSGGLERALGRSTWGLALSMGVEFLKEFQRTLDEIAADEAFQTMTAQTGALETEIRRLKGAEDDQLEGMDARLNALREQNQEIERQIALKSAADRTGKAEGRLAQDEALALDVLSAQGQAANLRLQGDREAVTDAREQERELKQRYAREDEIDAAEKGRRDAQAYWSAQIEVLSQAEQAARQARAEGKTPAEIEAAVQASLRGGGAPFVGPPSAAQAAAAAAAAPGAGGIPERPRDPLGETIANFGYGDLKISSLTRAVETLLNTAGFDPNTSYVNASPYAQRLLYGETSAPPAPVSAPSSMPQWGPGFSATAPAGPTMPAAQPYAPGSTTVNIHLGDGTVVRPTGGSFKQRLIDLLNQDPDIMTAVDRAGR